MMRRIFAALVLGTLAAAACESDPVDPLELTATGEVRGSAYVDVNGNLERDAADAALSGLRVQLYVRGTQDTVQSVLTGGDGAFRMELVPIGEYDVRVDPATVPDTLQIAIIENNPVHVFVADTPRVTIAAGFPIATVASARLEPAGKRIFIDATALNNRDDFADGAVHVTDGTASIRLTSLQAGALLRGNRARFLGVLRQENGQPTLQDVRFFVTDSVQTPPPVGLSTAAAANAQGGDLDAALVRVTRATVTSTQVVGTQYRFTVDDGTGALEVMVSLDRGFELGLLVAGTQLDLTGVLVPTGGLNRWQLRPRTPGDVTLGFPTVSIAEARTLPVGSRVIILGTALNSRDAFGDTTVHVADGTGAIRGTRVRPGTVLAGDRARFLGVISTAVGQPVIDDVTPFVIDVGTLPSPTPLTTGVAATASNGIFDAAHVQVRQATISDTTTVGAFLIIAVDDGTGRFEVAARKATSFSFENYAPGAIIDATGVLVPVGQGRWQLRARTNADIRVNQ